MARFEPYLSFDGTCAEAMRFYETTLGGRIEMQMTFDAIPAGGQVTMPYGKTFRADGFGMCVDKFGTPWMVNAGDGGGETK